MEVIQTLFKNKTVLYHKGRFNTMQLGQTLEWYTKESEKDVFVNH